MTTPPLIGQTWGDEPERVRAVLVQESEQPFSALRPKLAAAHQALRFTLAGVTPEGAAFTPADGVGEDAWGIAEVLGHLISVETIMADRVRQLGSGAPLNLPATYPGFREGVQTRQLPDLRGLLDQSHAALLAAIDAIDGQERLDQVDTHRRFGDLNCRGWVAMHTRHLLDHARQIGNIKARADYPASKGA
jgi:hypothetical protein